MEVKPDKNDPAAPARRAARAWERAAHQMPRDKLVQIKYAQAVNRLHTLGERTFLSELEPGRELDTRTLRVRIAERARDIDPNARVPHVVLGRFALADAAAVGGRRRAEFLERAGRHYLELSKRYPLMPLFVLYRGDVRLLEGETQDAERLYREAFARNRRMHDQRTMLQYLFDSRSFAWGRTPEIEADVFLALDRVVEGSAPPLRLRLAYQCRMLYAQPWPVLMHPARARRVLTPVLKALTREDAPKTAGELKHACLRRGAQALESLIRDAPDYEPEQARIFLGYFKYDLDLRLEAGRIWRVAKDMNRTHPSAVAPAAFDVIRNLRGN